MSRIENALQRAVERRAESQSIPRAAENETAPGFGGFQKAPPLEVMERIAMQDMLVTLNAPLSSAAEEYRKLKQEIVKHSSKGGKLNTILVTSGGINEGKSVTAVNLAISIAQEFDHTVLLVDADLRRPSCHELLCIDATTGLSDCLMQGREIGPKIINTGLGKLAFLPAGTPMLNPGELLGSRRMSQLLKEMRERYPDRSVIIDSPPLLPFAEAKTLAKMVDGVVLAVRENQVRKNELRETVEQLRGVNLVGAVYTHAKLGMRHRLYGSYSGYRGYAAR